MSIIGNHFVPPTEDKLPSSTRSNEDRTKPMPTVRLVIHVDDAKDAVLVSILRALLLGGNIPSVPSEIAAMIIHFGLATTGLGGATPQATVSSRISKYFKRCSSSKPARKPILGIWSGPNARHLRYFIDREGIPVGKLTEARIMAKPTMPLPAPRCRKREVVVGSRSSARNKKESTESVNLRDDFHERRHMDLDVDQQHVDSEMSDVISPSSPPFSPESRDEGNAPSRADSAVDLADEEEMERKSDRSRSRVVRLSLPLVHDEEANFESSVVEESAPSETESDCDKCEPSIDRTQSRPVRLNLPIEQTNTSSESFLGPLFEYLGSATSLYL